MREINSVDIYCQVIDNYGDAGICWRLARSLARCGLAVNLWIDDLSRLAALRPVVRTTSEIQTLDGFVVRRWGEVPAPEHKPADLVIEAFGCRMPETRQAAMAQRNPRSVWINLEYLSAEAWVSDHHGLPSPHASLPLTRYFFFPGFDSQSGGLIREPDLLPGRDAFDAAARAAFLARLGIALRPDERLISMFCYPLAPLQDLWHQLRDGPPVLCVLPGADEGLSAEADQGALRIQPLPFLDPDDYDRLLWSADLNFVRGEDSAVRAQWAARPFIWQLYPQAEAAHHAKCDAFLSRYLSEVDHALAAQIAHGWRWWNRQIGASPNLTALWQALPEWSLHAGRWAAQLHSQSDLASRLLGFARKIG